VPISGQYLTKRGLTCPDQAGNIIERGDRRGRIADEEGAMNEPEEGVATGVIKQANLYPKL
jgi:hypothetical protein